MWEIPTYDEVVVMPGTLEELKVADQKGRVLLGSRYAGKRFILRKDADGATILTPVTLIPEADGLITSSGLAKRFAALESLNDDWDGNGSLAPSSELISYAREVMALLQASALARNLRWDEPHIGSNERGQISLEWWNGNRTLTVFVRNEEQVDYLKAWGATIETEMEDGTIDRLADFITLSHWLYRTDS